MPLSVSDSAAEAKTESESASESESESDSDSDSEAESKSDSEAEAEAIKAEAEAEMNEYDGLSIPAVLVLMQEVEYFISEMVKRTTNPRVYLSTPQTEKDTITFTFKRQVPGKELHAIVRVNFTKGDPAKSVSCEGFMRYKKSWLRFTEISDVRAFITRRLAPRISACLSTADIINALDHIAAKTGAKKALATTTSTLEHEVNEAFFVIKREISVHDIRVFQMWLVHDDLLQMKSRKNDGRWREITCCENRPIVMTAAELEEADNWGDFHSHHQNVWGQIIIELGMGDLLHKEDLPENIQKAISVWTDAFNSPPLHPHKPLDLACSARGRPCSASASGRRGLKAEPILQPTANNMQQRDQSGVHR